MSELWRDERHEKERKEKLATYLFAMKEDLSEWIAGLMNITINADTFMDVLDNGIHLCRLANMIQRAAVKFMNDHPHNELKLPNFLPTFKERGATHGSFVSRDNVANFIRWCRELGIAEVIMFESEDLVLHKFQKPVILTLLDVARRAAKFDIEPPDLVIMEEQIDEEIALEREAVADVPMADTHENIREPVVAKAKKKEEKRKTKNFIPKNLDTLVKETVEQCTCEDSIFPVEKIADGKYKIGENRVLIFVRVMRNHVMVRVGGGWDTLENYIQKHDPCRNGGRGSNGVRQRSKCVNHQNHEISLLQSSSTTSVASNESNSSTSSAPRFSPMSNSSNALQGMVCVFGESGTRTEASPAGDAKKMTSSSSVVKRLDVPDQKRRKSMSSKPNTGLKGMGTRYSSLGDIRDYENKGTKTKPPCTPQKTPNNRNMMALRASLQQADLTFGRSRTSDAILSRRKPKERPNSVIIRRSNGNLSREASSENLRPKSAGTRRKSVDERRKRSPEVRRRSAVSPVSARRRLESEYPSIEQKNGRLRKDLNENNLSFERTFSADSITKGVKARKMCNLSVNGPGTRSSDRYTSQSRIPVPVTTYGKPRGSNRTSVLEDIQSCSSANRSSSSGINNKCIHCRGDGCVCDEGFIDGDGSRTPLRPASLFRSEQDDVCCAMNHEDKSTNDCSVEQENSKFLGKSEQCNDNGKLSGNPELDSETSLEWREVMTDILNYEEHRISDKTF